MGIRERSLRSNLNVRPGTTDKLSGCLREQDKSDEVTNVETVLGVTEDWGTKMSASNENSVRRVGCALWVVRLMA